mmetsp:Transcript_28892/g.83460  ORF Transcript_28892/g.83460 Transcript_28892/m.83460 type:complete len:301 (+) Transcript_28892:374-1276(+)
MMRTSRQVGRTHRQLPTLCFLLYLPLSPRLKAGKLLVVLIFVTGVTKLVVRSLLCASDAVNPVLLDVAHKAQEPAVPTVDHLLHEGRLRLPQLLVEAAAARPAATAHRSVATLVDLAVVDPCGLLDGLEEELGTVLDECAAECVWEEAGHLPLTDGRCLQHYPSVVIGVCQYPRPVGPVQPQQRHISLVGSREVEAPEHFLECELVGEALHHLAALLRVDPACAQYQLVQVPVHQRHVRDPPDVAQQEGEELPLVVGDLSLQCGVVEGRLGCAEPAVQLHQEEIGRVGPHAALVHHQIHH